jgi:hypothetical protein
MVALFLEWRAEVVAKMLNHARTHVLTEIDSN